MREITEVHTFTREQIEVILKSVAKMRIIGSLYKGHFGEQVVTPDINGGYIVKTTHTPSER